MTQANSMEQTEFTLVIERVFDAPREQVWKEWTDHNLRKQWLSPKGFYVSEDEGNIQTGEFYEACMVSPEGNESRYAGEYLEIKEHEKLVFTHTWQNDTCGIPNIETICTVLLEETDDGKTKMTFTQSGISSATSRDSQNSGWSECFDKLQNLLF